MYTEEQLKVTLETLTLLKAEDPNIDPQLYTTDHIIDMLIDYFKFLQRESKAPLSPRQAYERAMQVVK